MYIPFLNADKSTNLWISKNVRYIYDERKDEISFFLSFVLFWLFPKLRGCRYKTIEVMKEGVSKVIDTLTQEDFHGAFQKLLKLYNKCIAARGDYFEGD